MSNLVENLRDARSYEEVDALLINVTPFRRQDKVTQQFLTPELGKEQSLIRFKVEGNDAVKTAIVFNESAFIKGLPPVVGTNPLPCKVSLYENTGADGVVYTNVQRVDYEVSNLSANALTLMMFEKK